MVADRKTELIRIATELVMQNGFDSFSYSDLAKHLNIRKASIHHHFPKKQDLGLAILDQVKGSCADHFQCISSQSISASKKLDLAFNLGRDLCDSGNRICPVGSFQAEFNVIPPSMQTKLREIEDLEIDFFTKILDQGRKEGCFHFQGTPRDEALFVVSTLKGALQYARTHDKSIFAKAVNQLKRSLKPQATPAAA
ncbi:MAG: TetR/AcrR family transcriptional regulator [Verrucomicrobiota bacterium]